MDSFDTIIGSGGFGLVVGRDKDNNSREAIVAKFLYKSGGAKDVCDDAELEYNKHLDIYNAFELAKDPIYSQICISKPLAFDRYPIVKFGKEFSCYYMMTKLQSIDDKGLYHIVNNSFENMNRIIGRDYAKAVSENNPPRGFFATYSYIDNMLKNLNIKR